jgi:hypothetical protein
MGEFDQLAREAFLKRHGFGKAKWWYAIHEAIRLKGDRRRAIGDSLPSSWRERVHYLREYGDSNTARLWDLAAEELDAALAAHGQETLTLVQAARESGFTADLLSALVKNERIPNAGRDGAPRIRRADLLMKRVGGPGRPSHAPQLEAEREQVRKIAQSFTRKRLSENACN